MALPTPADIEALMAETEAARDLLRWKSQELKAALDALRAAHDPNQVTVQTKADRRRED